MNTINMFKLRGFSEVATLQRYKVVARDPGEDKNTEPIASKERQKAGYCVRYKVTQKNNNMYMYRMSNKMTFGNLKIHTCWSRIFSLDIDLDTTYWADFWWTLSKSQALGQLRVEDGASCCVKSEEKKQDINAYPF